MVKAPPVVSPKSVIKQRLLIRHLKALHRQFEEGNDSALLHAVDLIVLNCAPAWVRETWFQRFNDFILSRKPSLDAAFKVERPYKHHRDQQKREELRVPLMYHVAAMEAAGKTRDAAIAAFAKEYDVKKRWADALFYEKASDRYRKFFGIRMQSRPK